MEPESRSSKYVKCALPRRQSQERLRISAVSLRIPPRCGSERAAASQSVCKHSGRGGVNKNPARPALTLALLRVLCLPSPSRRVSLDVQARRGEVSERAHVWVISSDFEHYIITDNANKLEVALDGLRLFKISLIIS